MVFAGAGGADARAGVAPAPAIEVGDLIDDVIVAVLQGQRLTAIAQAARKRPEGREKYQICPKPLFLTDKIHIVHDVEDLDRARARWPDSIAARIPAPPAPALKW